MTLDAVQPTCVTKNRLILGAFSLFTVGLLLSSLSGRAAGETFLLGAPSQEGCLRVQAHLRAEGKLLVGSGNDSDLRSLPLHVEGKLGFVQANLPIQTGDKQLRFVRKYEKADAKITVDGRKDLVTLSDDRRMIFATHTDDGLMLDPLKGPLTREEVELLQMQCDLTTLPLLLPDTSIAAGERWPLREGAAAPLFGLDALKSCDVKCTLKQVTSDFLQIEFAGEIVGATLGAKSELEVDGQLRLDRKTRSFRSLKLKIREQREVGMVTPGFDIKAEMEVSFQSVDPPAELHADRIAALKLSCPTGSRSLEFTSDALGCSLVHDRRWRVTMHRADLLVLRLVDCGQVISQCRISTLDNAPADAAADRTKFRKQIEALLGESLGRIEEAAHATNDEGIEILRITATGVAGKTPTTWIYYLLTSSDGRRLAALFTVIGEQEKQFAAADHDLIGSLRFSPPRGSRAALNPHRRWKR